MNSAQTTIVKEFIESLDEPAVSISKEIYEKLISVDSKGEISQLSKLFLESLKNAEQSSKSTLDSLGAANFFVWMAYSLYDGALDQDLPLNSIPVANILERKALELYHHTAQNLDIILNLFNQTDQANAWELSWCRFQAPNSEVTIAHIPTSDDFMTMLASRSIAHIAGPTLLFETYTKNSELQQNLFEGLTDYCIARQLNDDLHDWIDDFNKGRLTYVVAYLLDAARYIPGTTVSTAGLLAKMKRAFYESGVEVLCTEVEMRITSAINKLVACNVSKNTLFIQQFLQPILETAKQARKVHKINQDFVKAFANK